jgi:hypothetical protein
MKKIELGELFHTLEKFGLNREEIFADQTLKLIRKDWKLIVGDLLGDGSYPNDFKDGRLLVMCQHSMIAQELDFSRREILQKIASLKLPLSVTKIIFKAGNSPILKK